MSDKPSIGIFGLTSCAGDQLVILDCEDELLKLAELVSIEEFLMAMDDPEEKPSHLDVAFVEGTVVIPEDLKTLKDVRSRSDYLIAIGSCACSGGPPGILNKDETEKALTEVVGKKYVKDFPVLEPQPLKAYVDVDFSLTGCPIEKDEFLYLVGSLLRGELPDLRLTAVCAECIYNANTCLLIEEGKPCLGPITRGGCGARCPTRGGLCIGCKGPVEEANVSSHLNALLDHTGSIDELKRLAGIFWGADLRDGFIKLLEEVEK
jgi:coenzyme F420-reducing hydrogenase gamma subunit